MGFVLAGSSIVSSTVVSSLDCVTVVSSTGLVVVPVSVVAQAVSVMARGKAARIAVSLRLITLIVGVCSLRFLEVAELLSSTGSGRLCSLLPGFWRVAFPVTEDTGVC